MRNLMTNAAIFLRSVFLTGAILYFSTAGRGASPAPLGRMVDLGGHRLHILCVGSGSPTVVVENGLGDFSFDWLLVQRSTAKFTRICTYDRAGYAWSDSGPKPRTFDQVNLELHDALAKLHEHSPFVLVGHSYGGPLVRNFALTYPREVAAIVLIDSAFEGMRVGVGGGKTMRLGMDSRNRDIPRPHEQMLESDQPSRAQDDSGRNATLLDPMYKVLPASDQSLQLWAQALPQLKDAEGSQREWSVEYFSKWLQTPENASLGSLPLVVVMREKGGYGDDQDVSGAQMERERKEGQARLAALSTNARKLVFNTGHNMELEAPEDVTAAIRMAVDAVRNDGQFNSRSTW
jgi:pimeloyl-ACP methyl ester carboxylesterase